MRQVQNGEVYKERFVVRLGVFLYFSVHGVTEPSVHAMLNDGGFA